MSANEGKDMFEVSKVNRELKDPQINYPDEIKNIIENLRIKQMEEK